MKKTGIAIVLLVSILAIYAFGNRQTPKVKGYIYKLEYHKREPMPNIEVILRETQVRCIADGCNTIYNKVHSKVITDEKGMFGFESVKKDRKKSSINIECSLPDYQPMFWAKKQYNTYDSKEKKVSLFHYSPDMSDTLFLYDLWPVVIELNVNNSNPNDSIRITIGDKSKKLFIRAVPNKNATMFHQYETLQRAATGGNDLSEKILVLKGRGIPIKVEKIKSGKKTVDNLFINPGYNNDNLNENKLQIYSYSL